MKKKWKYKYADKVKVKMVNDPLVNGKVPLVTAKNHPKYTAPIYYPNGYENNVECFIYSDKIIPGLKLKKEKVKYRD